MFPDDRRTAPSRKIVAGAIRLTAVEHLPSSSWGPRAAIGAAWPQGARAEPAPAAGRGVPR